MKIIGCFVLLLTVLAGVFRMLDVLWDRQDKDRLKEKILDFWINTAEIAFVEQLHRALEARYARMRSLRKNFVHLFWILCVAVAILATFESLRADRANMQSGYKEMFQTDFNYRYIIHCAYLMSGKSSEGIKATCDPQKRANAPPELAIYQERETKFHNLISEVGTGFLLLSGISSTIISIIVVALPLTAALLISLNVTLWILSRITRSRLACTRFG